MKQQAVDRAYGRLWTICGRNVATRDTVRAAGTVSPTQRSERDSFCHNVRNRLTQLRSVEDRLFGRLDAKNGDRHYIGGASA